MKDTSKSALSRHLLTIAVTLFIAAIAASMTYGAVKEKVQANEAAVVQIRKDVKETGGHINELRTGQAVNANRLENIENMLKRIETKLDRPKK